MKQPIYLDVLICVNLLIDYFLLYAAAQLTGRVISRIRLCLGALLGAFCSCIILLPSLPWSIHLLLSAAVSILMTLIAFGFCSIGRLLKSSAALLCVTLCYGGLMTAVWLFAAPKGLIINNGAVYVDISPTLLVFFTVISYAAISVGAKYLRRRNLSRSRCSLIIFTDIGSVRLEAIIDTGNLLTEPFSGLPVIVSEPEALRPILSDELLRLIDMCDGNGDIDAAGRGLRIIPYSSIGGGGVMPAFRPKSISIELSGKRSDNVQAYIGLLRSGKIGKGYHAIVNPDAII